MKATIILAFHLFAISAIAQNELPKSQSCEREETAVVSEEEIKDKTENLTEGFKIGHEERQAIVVAQKTSLNRGDKYQADITMLSADTNCIYKAYVNGKEIENGHYSALCNIIGTFKYKGYIQETDKKGETRDYPFSAQYQVIEPTVFVKAINKNLLFTGIDNPIIIQAPGINSSDISVTMSNARITRTANGFMVKPVKIGCECHCTVSIKDDEGKHKIIAKETFISISLPCPDACLKVNDRYFFGGKIDKEDIETAKKVSAETYDNIYLNLMDKKPEYIVKEFDMKFVDENGVFVVYHSNTDDLTDQMTEAIKKMDAGSTFYISNVISKGRDNLTQKSKPMEIIIK